ncbi:MAG: hypothetical protein J6Q14_03515 [Oscillospiraceae bacterium]|nr:hypothetical protein [Oscillospiraceae bacterium]
MNVTKQAVCDGHTEVEEQELEQINRFSRAKLSAQQVYTFTVRLCDNEVDRDGERFAPETLEGLAELFVGKSGIFDHQWSAAGQTARIYRTQVVDEPGTLTRAGDGYRYVKAWAYMLRTKGNEELIAQLEGGILREVSVGCAVERTVCSVCGARVGSCEHRKGETYGGKLCFTSLEGAADAFEWSFVAVPAQPKAGVMKSKRAHGTRSLKTLAEREGFDEEYRQLEKQAALGRSYLDALRREVVRLAGLGEQSVEHAVMERIAKKLEEDELLELKRVYSARAQKQFGLVTQLDHGVRSETVEDTDGAFLI